MRGECVEGETVYGVGGTNRGGEVDRETDGEIGEDII